MGPPRHGCYPMAALGGTNAAAVAMPEVSVYLVFTDTRLDFEAMGMAG